MSLTLAQYNTLLADIQANTATVQINGQPVQIKNVLMSPDNAASIAGWYNLPAAGPFVIWRDLDMAVVIGLITYANMTPLDPPDGTQLWANRSLACQGKQFNLQNLTIGRTTAPMKRANYRSALNDCLTNLPSGAAGAVLGANWPAVRDAAKFSATNAEKLFATGTGTSATPADLSFEGSMAGPDVLLPPAL